MLVIISHIFIIGKERLKSVEKSLMAIPRETTTRARYKKKHSPPSRRSKRVTFPDDLLCTGYQTDIEEIGDDESIATRDCDHTDSCDVMEHDGDVIYFETFDESNTRSQQTEKDKTTVNHMSIDEDLFYFDESDGECDHRENSRTMVPDLKGSVRNLVACSMGFICSKTIGYDQ